MKPSELLQRIVKAEQIADKGALYELGRELDRLHGDGTRHEYGLRDLGDGLIGRSFTPTLYQAAAVSATVQVARYQVVGPFVHVVAYLTATAAGTIANAIQIQNLPKFNINANPVHAGIFHVTTPTTHYSGTAWINSSDNSVRGFGLSATGAIGFSPSFALAVGHIVGCNLYYEYKP